MTADPSRTWHDGAIERGMAVLLVFSPLAFGAVQVWAMSLLQIGSFLLFLLWLRKTSREEVLIVHGWRIILPAGLFLVIVLLQLMPLPFAVLKAISPASAEVHAGGGPTAPVWRPLSIHPQATLREFLNFLAYVLIFVVVVNHWRRREQVLRLVRLIIGMGCVLVVLAVVQKLFWNGRLYWFYPIAPILESRLEYIWGPYVNRNHFAGYLELVIPLALSTLLYHASRSTGGDRARLRSYLLTLAKNRRLSMLVVLLSAVVVLSGALFATLSRGAILGFLASLLFFIATAGTRRSQRGRALVVIVVAAVLSLVGLVAAWDRIEDRFSDIAEENRIVRPAVWADTMRVVRAYPVLGSGLGTFERSFPRYQSGYTAVRFEHAESDYLEVLAETGVLGATLAATTLVAFFSTAISAWRRRRGSLPVLLGLGGTTSCLAISVHGLTDFNLRIPANAFLLAVVAGLTVVVLSRGGRVGRSAAGPGMPDQAEVA